VLQCSHDENFAWLNRKDDGSTAVKLANPKTLEYQVVRTSLLPGLLKTIRENQSRPKPIRIFEVSDVSLKDSAAERRARNERRVAAVHCDRSGSFEAVHGLLDRLMLVLGVKWLKPGSPADAPGPAYYIEKLEGASASLPSAKRGGIPDRTDPTYLPGRGARILFRAKAASTAAKGPEPPAEASSTAAVSQTDSSIPLADAVPQDEPSAAARPKPSAFDTLKTSLASVLPGSSGSGSGDVVIGSLGILHPSVLGKFEIPFPISAVEFSLEGL
jgi:phenylalanyl-tRNA synthetase beta chain